MMRAWRWCNRAVSLMAMLLAARCWVPAQEPMQKPRTLHELEASAIWQLNVPSANFDASGLLWRQGKLLVIGDKSPIVYEIILPSSGDSADVREFSRCFVGATTNRMDAEGLAQDDEGRLLLVNESARTVLRSSKDLSSFEELTFKFGKTAESFSSDKNASFEGVAFGNGLIYLANERSPERVLVMDPVTLAVSREFTPRPSGAELFWHYSDLSWHEGKLFLLARHSRVILEVDPATEQVLTEHSYKNIEKSEKVAYRTTLGFGFGTGAMEGLAVTPDAFWIVTDNNGQPRRKFPNDKRPTLVKCLRPR